MLLDLYMVRLTNQNQVENLLIFKSYDTESGWNERIHDLFFTSTVYTYKMAGVVALNNYVCFDSG